MIFVSVLAVIVWQLRDVWFLLAVALFFSYMIAPIVNWVETRLPSGLLAAKTQALLVVYVALVGTMVAAVSWVVGNAVAQASGLAERIPDLMKNQDALLTFPLPEWLEPARQSVVTWAKHLLAGGFEQFLPVLRTISGQLLLGLGSLMPFLLVPVFAFFFLKDGNELSAAIIERFPEEHQPFVRSIFYDLNVQVVDIAGAKVTLALRRYE